MKGIGLGVRDPESLHEHRREIYNLSNLETRSSPNRFGQNTLGESRFSENPKKPKLNFHQYFIFTTTHYSSTFPGHKQTQTENMATRTKTLPITMPEIEKIFKNSSNSEFN